MTGRRPGNAPEVSPGTRSPAHERRAGPVSVLFLAALLIPLALGAAPARKPGAADPLASLKVGQWIQIEGAVQGDTTSRCDELRILTGDFVEDDWIVKGHIQALDAANREFTVAGVRVQVTEDTRFDSPKKPFQGFTDLRAGLLVEVEGTFLKGRRLLATELDDESEDAARVSWAGNQILVVGKVERVDSRKRLVAAMGFVFQVTDKTRIRSVIE